MKGIVLAGGSGTRLYPITKGISKQLLPVYDKPMIYYPISVLMLAGIRDILVISAPEFLSHYQNLLGDGSSFGIQISYVIQKSPDGLPQAFILGEEFIADDNVCLILGDNIFYGQDFISRLKIASDRKDGATIFLYMVKNPERFGVVGFDENQLINSIEEKPENPKSKYVVTGIYFFDKNVVQIAKNLKPSKRNELEIIDVIKAYLDKGNLNHFVLGRGFAWLDTGTYDSLIDASQFVHTIEKRQGFKIACLEEIAYHHGWLSGDEIIKQAEMYNNNSYGRYLLNLLP